VTGRTELSHADALFVQGDWPGALLKYDEATRKSRAVLKGAAEKREQLAKADATRWETARIGALAKHDLAAVGGASWQRAQESAAAAAAALNTDDYAQSRKLYADAAELLGAAVQAAEKAQASAPKPGDEARVAWRKTLAAANVTVKLNIYGGMEWLPVSRIARKADDALRDGKAVEAVRLYAEAAKALPDVVAAAIPRMKARRVKAEKARDIWLATERLTPPPFVMVRYESQKWRTVQEHRQAADAAMTEQDYATAEELYRSADMLLELALVATREKGWTVATRRTTVATSKGIKQQEITHYTTPQKMVFVRIPAGEFTMGSPRNEAGRDVDEGPAHKVVITRPYYMMTTEITQAQYETIQGKTPAHFKDKRNPVEQVTWLEAVEFCRTLSGKEGFTYRLPTECEWEYACRAGTTTAFYTGAALTSTQANINGREFRNKTVPVGSFSANPWGLLDMHGNVWEWCSDWYSERAYATSPKADPHGPRTGKSRVLRGGAWRSGAERARCAARSRSLQADFDTLSGIRIVLPSVQADRKP